MNISNFINTINSKPTTKFHLSSNSAIERSKLRKIENKLAINLPNDLVEFYTSCNGLEGDDDIFNIVRFEQVEKDYDDLGPYLVFAEYMIYIETCGLEIDPIDKNKYRFFNTSSNPIEDRVIKRNYIADSIEDFIRIYCRKGTWGIWGDENDKDQDMTDETEYEAEKNENNLLDNKKSWWKFW